MNLNYCITWRKREKETYLRFHCDNINDLKKLDAVTETEIIISGLKQKEFEVFCNEYADKFQIVQLEHCNLINDFSQLEKLQNLQFLIIDWNNKATKLWNMANNLLLKGLLLDDMMKIKHIDGIELAPALEELIIQEGVDVKLYLDTLEPLSKCDFIKKLGIHISGITDNSALPIIKMKSLEELALSAVLFETEQYAMLAARLKNVKISPNAPYIVYDKIDNSRKNNVLVIGKNKRWTSENSPKLKQYETEWNEYIQKYNS